MDAPAGTCSREILSSTPRGSEPWLAQLFLDSLEEVPVLTKRGSWIGVPHLWEGFYGPHTGNGRWARRVFLSAGVTSRHVAVDPTVEDISGWSTGARMVRYAAEAPDLAAAAGEAASTRPGWPPLTSVCL